jgi:hypothetical protein
MVCQKTGFPADFAAFGATKYVAEFQIETKGRPVRGIRRLV